VPAATSETVYERLCQLIFCGEYETGSPLVERTLADRLGVSRVPVRETLTKLVAQGALLGGRKGEGVRIRRYSPDEVQQLYDFRAQLEGGVARLAARAATEADLLRLTLVRDQMEAALDDDEPGRWGILDRKFHQALAEACRNDRFEQALKSLLNESFFVFYVLARRSSQRELSADQLARHKREALDDHSALIELVQQRDAEGAEQRARLHILRSAERVTRALIEADLRE